MKITFLLPGYPWVPIGGYSVVYIYANQLVNREHKVTVVHPRFMCNIPILPGFYRWVRRRLGIIRDIFLRPSVKWHFIDKRIKLLYVPEPTAKYIPDADVVFATAWQTAEYVWEYPPSKGKKFYLIQHYETWAGPKERVDATWILPMHKVVIANWLYKLGRELGVPEEEMKHIPNGIDHEKYRLINDINSRPKRVAMMFSLTDWKGSPDGIRALEIAKSRHSDLKAILFGVCPRPKNLPQWIEYVQNPPQDILVQEIYNGSSIYLCPSWTEGWHLPPAEAMACGCAVVATDIGGVHDYAIDGKTALLSPIRNPEALAENLIRLLDNDSLRLRLAQNGYANIQSFTWEYAADLLEEYIKEALEIKNLQSFSMATRPSNF